MKGKRVIILAVLLILSLPGWGLAQKDYPHRAVEIIVPWGPGSNADVIARMITPPLEKYFKQPFVVVDKSGGAGLIAHNQVAHAKPDGYTILSLNSIYGGLLATRKPSELKFSFDSFVPVVGYAATHVYFNVRKDAPWKTLPEFLEEARRNPGKMKFASTAVFGSAHIFATDLFKRAGVKVTHIPAKGSGDAMTSMLGGHVDMAVIHGSIGHVDGGTARVLTVAAEERRQDLPEVPTLKEMGYPIARPSVVGFAVPKGTPAETVSRLYEGVRQAIQANQEEFRSNLLKIEAILTLMDPGRYLELCKADKEYFFRMVPEIKKELGVRD
jgi:tripartite-type tricarboxylate transporter receptor subunit TctC